MPRPVGRCAALHCHLLPAVFRFRLPALLALIVILGGCARAVTLPLVGTLPGIDADPAPSRTAAMQRLHEATPCCHAWSDLPYNDPLPQSPQDFTIDRFTPVADIDGKRTRFLTFVLPQYQQPYRVVFQVQPNARGLHNSFLIAPTVTLLNADHQPLSSTDVSLCVYVSWRPGMSGAFGAVKVDNPSAHFLAVTTSPRQLAATTYWGQSPTSFGSVDVPSGAPMAGVRPSAPVTVGDFQVAHGPEGTLTLGRMTSAYRDAVDNGLCNKPAKGGGLLPALRSTLRNR